VPMGLPRVVPAGGRQLGPYFFAGGTEVTTQAFTNHRDQAIFKRAWEFEPERWETPTEEMNQSLMYFGGGTRTCLGQNLAMMELRLIAAAMLTQCEDAVLADSCTDESMEFENFFVVKPKSHKCELKKASI